MSSDAKQFDVFISHAREDKDEIARPLKNMLLERGYSVWLDESELTLGDSLLNKIDEGLANCRYGIVILSHAFFAKEWPQKELDGLVAREVNEGKKVILPVWHNITYDEIAAYSPTLAGKLAVKTEEGIEVVVEKIVEVLLNEPQDSPIQHSSKPKVKNPKASNDKELACEDLFAAGKKLHEDHPYILSTLRPPTIPYENTATRSVFICPKEPHSVLVELNTIENVMFDSSARLFNSRPFPNPNWTLSSLPGTVLFEQQDRNQVIERDLDTWKLQTTSPPNGISLNNTHMLVLHEKGSIYYEEGLYKENFQANDMNIEPYFSSYETIGLLLAVMVFGRNFYSNISYQGEISIRFCLDNIRGRRWTFNSGNSQMEHSKPSIAETVLANLECPVRGLTEKLEEYALRLTKEVLQSSNALQLASREDLLIGLISDILKKMGESLLNANDDS